jgi:hypothetical protein
VGGVVLQEVADPRLSTCNLNGRHWTSVAVRDPLLAMAVSADARWLVTGSETGEIVLRRLYE